MEWKPDRFVTQSPWGSRAVGGQVGGSFGIHEVDDIGPCWAVVHVPSGLYLTPDPGFRHRETAQQFCERIAGLTDWRTIDPDSPPSDLGDRILDAWADVRSAERRQATLRRRTN